LREPILHRRAKASAAAARLRIILRLMLRRPAPSNLAAARRGRPGRV